MRLSCPNCGATRDTRAGGGRGLPRTNTSARRCPGCGATMTFEHW